jgi:hypothetical protein
VGTDTPAAFAVDPATDRFYCVYVGIVKGKQRLFVVHSDDEGKRWGEPARVSPAAPEDSNQYQVRCAVDHRGALGVAWFDTRGNPGDTAYDLYFARSEDGGRAFQEIRVSSHSSAPVWTFDEDKVPFEKWVVPGFDSRRHLTGGDYIGLAADANGDFVMAWPDCRNDHRQQMYFARVMAKGRSGTGTR